MQFIFSHPDRPQIIEGMCRWVGPRIGASYDPHLHSGISVICENGVATVLYGDHSPRIDIRMHVAGEGNWFNRTSADVFFGYPFRELGLRRVTALIAKSNRKSRNLVEKLGFVREGAARQGAPNGENLILYGMLRKECKWLRDIDNGQTERSVAA